VSHLNLAAVATFAALTLAGCRTTADIPYLGRWEGDFTVKRVMGRTQIPNPSRNGWKGYIILYRTQDGALGNRCQAHLENEQEAVDLKGHWLVRARQISATFDNIKVDDAGGLDSRDPNKAYLEPNEINRAFSIPLVLTSEQKGKVLESPLRELGPLEGKFRFEKSALAH
jgi:hypothetical protein